MSTTQTMKEMARLMVELHATMATQGVDSDAAAALRDQMDEKGAALDASDMRLLAELSGDLSLQFEAVRSRGA